MELASKYDPAGGRIEMASALDWQQIIYFEARRSRALHSGDSAIEYDGRVAHEPHAQQHNPGHSDVLY